MFDGRAFRTWTRVIAGACVLSVLFLAVMVMAEAVIGDGARVTRAGLLMSAATFVGYIVVAGLIRLRETRSRSP
ncbi:MAG: ABC transporter permease [Salinibacter sp.]